MSRQSFAHVCQLYSRTSPPCDAAMLPANRAKEGPCQASAGQRDARGHRTRQCIFRAGGPGSTGASASAKRTCRSGGSEGRGKCGGSQGEPVKLLSHCAAACNRVWQWATANRMDTHAQMGCYISVMPACCPVGPVRNGTGLSGRGRQGQMVTWGLGTVTASLARLVLSTAYVEIVATRQKLLGQGCSLAGPAVQQPLLQTPQVSISAGFGLHAVLAVHCVCTIKVSSCGNCLMCRTMLSLAA